MASETASASLDDRTWDDLNMDDVFSVLDRTESVVGQQVLHARLRGDPHAAKRSAFEALVTRASDDSAARERAQLALSRLRAPSGYDLWWLAQPGSLETSRWHVLFPVVGITMVGVAAVTPIWPAAIFLLVLGAVGSVVARIAIASNLRVVAGAFRQVGPLVTAAEVMSSLNSDTTAPILGTLSTDASR